MSSAEDEGAGPQKLTYQIVSLANSPDGVRGLLVYWNRQLVALLSELDPALVPGPAGWFLEVGFGPCQTGPAGEIMHDIDTTLDAIRRRCSRW